MLFRSPGTRARVFAAGGDTAVDYSAAKFNEKRANTIAREELGLPPTATLNAKAFETALAAPELTGPYNAVRAIGRLTGDENIVASLNDLRSPSLIGGEAAAARVDKLIDSALEQIGNGVNGQQALDNIRNLRRNAQSIYTAQKKGGAPSQEALAVADAQMGVANTLETLIENNISNPQMLSDFQKARAGMARVYDYQRATNPITGQFDPAVAAKMLKEGKPLSGNLAAMARIADVYPEATQIGATPPSAWAGALKRSGTLGTLGAGVGMAIGGPGSSIIGGTIGGTVGLLGGRLGARRLMTPEAQAKFALPIDYRPVNALAERAPITENALAPYDWNQAVNAGQMGYQPNWRFGRGGVEPDVQAGIMPGAPQLPPPTAEQVMGAVRMGREYQYGAERAAAERASAAEDAAAAASRQTATGGTLYDFDPVTGKLQPASRGVPGATPETMLDFGRDLASAAEKVSSGRRFDLSAAEKIAWDKTKVDLAEVMPGFSKLSDKAITERMLDRQWVADTVQKAREKAAAFEQIAQRAKDDAARRQAAINRERMMDLADMMEEQMRAPRPIATPQGPKTREAIRNSLRGQNQNINALSR